MLKKGIFWVKDFERIYARESIIFLTVKCDADGNLLEEISADIASKSGKNLNHKNAWAILSNKLKKGKAFNYYPRGRVEIKNGKAIIYANPKIAENEELIEIIAELFCLTSENGITDIRVKSDFSNHYKSNAGGNKKYRIGPAYAIFLIVKFTYFNVFY